MCTSRFSRRRPRPSGVSSREGSPSCGPNSSASFRLSCNDAPSSVDRESSTRWLGPRTLNPQKKVRPLPPELISARPTAGQRTLNPRIVVRSHGREFRYRSFCGYDSSAYEADSTRSREARASRTPSTHLDGGGNPNVQGHVVPGREALGILRSLQPQAG